VQVLEADPELDLALMRVVPSSDAVRKTPSVWPAIEIGDSRAVELLDDLVVIGFPEKGGVTATVSRGIVEGKDNSEDWIKTDTRLLHGNSGGAAVNAEGKLIGVATKVEIDRARDGVQLGTVGYLRPSHLVSRMIDRWREKEKAMAEAGARNVNAPPPYGAASATPGAITVKGLVKFAVNGKPIAGARVGLIIPGREVAPEALIAWGGTNADGHFQFDKAVPPGKYTLRAKVIGDERYAIYNREIEIKPDLTLLVVEIEATGGR
jgi:S1-C subfamily serine protease